MSEGRQGGRQLPAAAEGEAGVRFLRLLAKRLAFAEAVAGGKQVAVVIEGVDGAARRVLETFPHGAVVEAERRSWLKCGGDLRWRITAQGRSALKRALSRIPDGNRLGHCSARPVAPRPARVAAVNVSESPLGWLFHRRGKSGAPLISQEQFAAGERLRADYYFAGLNQRVTANWSAVAPCSRGAAHASGDLADNVLAARERVSRALMAIGPELSGIAVDVCCHLRGLEEIERHNRWVARSAKVVLQLALTALARHYGLVTSQTVRSRTMHWGTPDYRPALDCEACDGDTAPV